MEEFSKVEPQVGKYSDLEVFRGWATGREIQWRGGRPQAQGLTPVLGRFLAHVAIFMVVCP